MPTGVTAATPANLVFEAGAVYRGGSILGATVDNNSYRIERDYVNPDLNGVKGMLMGTIYIDRSEAILEASIPEVSGAIMAAMWPGSVNTGGDIDETEDRLIATDQYADWKLVAAGLTNTFSFEADNGLNLGTIGGDLADDAPFAPRAEIHSTWDPAAMTVSPHRITVTATGS